MDVMNKYQEALDILVNAKFCRNAEHEKQLNEAIETLQKLVDMLTPKKPENIFIEDLFLKQGDCPNCHNPVHELYDCTYCVVCGQALLWGNEDENS